MNPQTTISKYTCRARCGSVLDIPVVIVSVFIVSIAFLFGHLVIDKTLENTTDDQIDQDTLEKAKNALEVGDAGIVFVKGALWLAAIIFAIRIPSRPIFFLPAMIFLVIATWVSAEIANIFNVIVNTSPIDETINSFPIMLTLFEKYPLVTGFLGVVLIIALYAKISGAPQITS